MTRGGGAGGCRESKKKKRKKSSGTGSVRLALQETAVCIEWRQVSGGN